jgi:hypothetical protein
MNLVYLFLSKHGITLPQQLDLQNFFDDARLNSKYCRIAFS